MVGLSHACETLSTARGCQLEGFSALGGPLGMGLRTGFTLSQRLPRRQGSSWNWKSILARHSAN